MYVGKNKLETLFTGRKPIFLKPQFNRGVAGDVLHNRLTRVVNRTFYADNPAFKSPSRSVISTHPYDYYYYYACLLTINLYVLPIIQSISL